MADEHEHGLVRPTLNTDTFDKGERQLQDVEAVEAEDEDNDKDDGQAQQEVNAWQRW
jgi:hypothetical protein